MRILNFWTQCTVVDKNHQNILAKNSDTKSCFSLEPRDQLQQKLKCSLLLSIEFTTKNDILFSKAIKASKARNLAMTGLVPHTFAKNIETRNVYYNMQEFIIKIKILQQGCEGPKSWPFLAFMAFKF